MAVFVISGECRTRRPSSFLLIPALLLLVLIATSGSLVHAKCSQDADCAAISGSSAPHVRCKAEQCSCDVGWFEEHTFADDGSKTMVTCSWIVPVWFWCLTHTIAFLLPIGIICCIGFFCRALGRAFGPPTN